jgi:integrase
MDDAASRVRAAVRAQMEARLAGIKPPGVMPPPLPKTPPPLTRKPDLGAIGTIADNSGGVDQVKRAKKHSKKGDLAQLPKQWRATVFAAMKPEKTSRLASSVALLWATGCRPVEIEKGVRVSMDNGQLLVEIQGAKHGLIDNGDVVADRGLEWRKLKINPALNAATEYLARLVKSGPVVVEYNKNSLRTRLNEIGRLAIRKMPEGVTISPYTFRHAMGSDVKSCDDYTDEERSMVLGHLSMDSLSVYGRRRHKGGVKPVASVEASATPRGEYTDSPKTSKRGAKPR